MIKLPLKVHKAHRLAQSVMHLRSAAPFVTNKRGVLVHRPYHACIYNAQTQTPHIGVHFFCNMAVCDNPKSQKLTFTDTLDMDALLCVRCEEIAIKKRLPAAHEIVGRHVHLGRTKGVKVCCEQA